MITDRLAKVREGRGGTQAITLIERLVIFALMAMMLSMMGPAFVKVRANAAFVDGHAETLTPGQLGYGLPLGHPKNCWDRH